MASLNFIEELKSYQTDLGERLSKVRRLLREQKIARHCFDGKDTVSQKDAIRITNLQKQEEELSAEYARASFRLRNRRTHGE